VCMDSLDKNLGTLNPQVLGSSPRGRTTLGRTSETPVAEAQILPHRQFRVQSFDRQVRSPMRKPPNGRPMASLVRSFREASRNASPQFVAEGAGSLPCFDELDRRPVAHHELCSTHANTQRGR
jgi:hypothetical protein